MEHSPEIKKQFLMQETSERITENLSYFQV
jgi:hypothetical protein